MCWLVRLPLGRWGPRVGMVDRGFVLDLTEQHVRRMMWPGARTIVCGVGCELVANRLAPVFALHVVVDVGMDPLMWRLM